MALRQIGILTLAKNDDTDTFNEFRKQLHVHHKEGEEVSLHFRFANGDNSKLSALAQQLLDIPVEVIVTAGTRAFNAVLDLNPNIRIIQAVGGEDPSAGGPNRTGFHLNVLQMCKNQFNDLKAKNITDLTILQDSTSQSTNAIKPFHEQMGGTASLFGRARPCLSHDVAGAVGNSRNSACLGLAGWIC